MIELNKAPLFKLGKVVATPGALEALEESKTQVWELLNRHIQGDFGDIDETDRLANLAAINDGSRILSAYTLPTGDRLWVISEADRSSTCILRPEDY
jgi:hypothetical protein